jgi:hypothetical protein
MKKVCMGPLGASDFFPIKLSFVRLCPIQTGHEKNYCHRQTDWDDTPTEETKKKTLTKKEAEKELNTEVEQTEKRMKKKPPILFEISLRFYVRRHDDGWRLNGWMQIKLFFFVCFCLFW